MLTLLLLLAAAPAAAQGVMAEKGDLRLQHVFEGVPEPAHYRLYVPTTYDPAKTYPLVVVLHGSGEDENGPFDRTPELKAIAEQRGYILLAPFGSRRGGYGNCYPVVVTRETAASLPSADQVAVRPAGGPRPQATAPVPADDFVYQSATELQPDFRAAARSEVETMNVLALVRSQYHIEPDAIYLMGNSMGGLGTAYLTARYPQIWAGIAPSGGPVAAWSYPFERLRQHHIGALFVHGELDEHASAHWSQVLVDSAKAEGVDATMLLVPGGHHGNAWAKALPQTFDFFARHVNHAH